MRHRHRAPAIHFFDPLRTHPREGHQFELARFAGPTGGPWMALDAAITFASMAWLPRRLAAGNDGTDNEVYPTYPAEPWQPEPAHQGSSVDGPRDRSLRRPRRLFPITEDTSSISAGGPAYSCRRGVISWTRRDMLNTAALAPTAYVSAGAALVFALNRKTGTGPVRLADAARRSPST